MYLYEYVVCVIVINVIFVVDAFIRTRPVSHQMFRSKLNFMGRGGGEIIKIIIRNNDNIITISIILYLHI